MGVTSQAPYNLGLFISVSEVLSFPPQGAASMELHFASAALTAFGATSWTNMSKKSCRDALLVFARNISLTL
ncbi:hypothetical protein [Rahnella sp. CFA14(1/10)]|uniref:hypothetical protein n=1 Tax=Rahnella sp. CFA14(1/10) TaxID=2511203 RepID=UPI001020145C|nr:hypothetical protein [Rahnella sp. CFA14(1/10)]